MYCLFDGKQYCRFFAYFAAWRLCILVRGDDVFDRKLTHWQFPVLFLDTKRKSLEGGRAVLAAAAQYGYEIKENYQRD